MSAKMEDNSHLVSQDTSSSVSKSTDSVNSWKSRTNNRLHLEAQRRSLEYHIGEYLTLRRDISSEYGTLS
jgi:hypothetical protein